MLYFHAWIENDTHTTVAQATAKLPVLRGAQPRVEKPADIRERFAGHYEIHHRRGIDWACGLAQRSHDPVMEVPRDIAAHCHGRDTATDCGAVVAVKTRNHFLDPVFGHNYIVVGEQKHLAASTRRSGVARGTRRTAIGIDDMQPPRVLGNAFGERRGRLVRGRIVHIDDFVIGVGLRHHALNVITERGGAVVRGHNYADARHGIPPSVQI